MSISIDYNVIIIGGGIIGCAINYELSKYNLEILQLEKNPYLAEETTAGNSGVIHGGFDANEHKVEAFLNVRGNFLWQTSVFKNLKFPHKQINSLVLAFNDEEIAEIEKLYRRGIINGLTPDQVKIIDHGEIIEREPYVNPEVKKALLCLTSCIVDPVKAAIAFAGGAINNGSTILKSAEVTNITWSDEDGYFEVVINRKRTISSKYIINAAGHGADDIAQLVGCPDFKQETRRGEFLVLAKDQFRKVKNICFLSPTKYGKGVLVEPLLNGRVLVGPTSQDGVDKNDARLIVDASAAQIRSIASKIIPTLDFSRIENKYAGSRSIDIATNDFVIGPSPNNSNFINAAGMQSPGLSAAPAIAELIANILLAGDKSITAKSNFIKEYELIW